MPLTVEVSSSPSPLVSPKARLVVITKEVMLAWPSGDAITSKLEDKGSMSEEEGV